MAYTLPGLGGGGTYTKPDFTKSTLTGPTTAPTVIQAPAPAPAPTPIAADTLTENVQPLSLPTPTQQPDFLGTLAAIPSLAEITAGIDTPSETEKTQNTLMSSILESVSKITGRKTAQLQEENNRGIPQMQTQLQDYTNQINALQAEAKAIPLQIQNESEGRGRTAAGVAPIQADRLRTNTIRALGLSAVAQTIQGNIALAQSQADRAVELEFGPEEAKLDYLREALKMNGEILSREDQKRVTKMNAALDERSRVLSERKEDKSIILGWAAEAAKNGAPSVLVSQALQAANPRAALGILQSFMRDPNEKAMQLLQMDAIRANIRQSNAAADASAATAAKTRAETGGMPGMSDAGNPFVFQPAYGRLTAKQKTQADSLNNLVRSITEYKAYVNDNVNRTGVKMTGEEAAVLQTKLNSIIFAAAQAEGTGALQQADREVIEKIIPNPTSIGGAWSAITKGGKAGQLLQLEDQISKYTQNLAGYGLKPTGTTMSLPATRQVYYQGKLYNVAPNGDMTPA